MRAWTQLAAIALTLTLLGCGRVIVDAGQVRLCRLAIPVLNGPDDGLEITLVEPLRSEPGVRIAYLALPPGSQPRQRSIACRFAADDLASPGRAHLIGVATESGPLGEARLRFLQRFWLESADATWSDPAPVANIARAPELPPALALALQHLLGALPLVAIYGLLAAAYSLVYGLVGRINLAFGEIAAIGGYATVLGIAFVSGSGGPWAPLAGGLVLAGIAALSYGTVSGWLVFKPLMRQGGQQTLIGTIALAIVLQEYLRLTQGSKMIWIQPIFNEPIAVARAGRFIVTITPIGVVIAAVSLVAGLSLLAIMRWTRFGLVWRASADDPGTAALFGVSADRTLMLTFALASALAGLAGYIITVFYGGVGYMGGIIIGLKALIAAIAGGIGSIPGSFLGGLLLGATEAVWSALFPVEYRDVVVFGLLSVLLILRPGGLLGFGDLAPRRV